jgi:threonine dehydrogenase-like Zn-dependent dehydrogenase
MEIREVEVAPGPGEIMVKVAVCGLCNWELNHWHGILGTPPQPLGHEWAGEVVALGEGIEDIALGAQVTGFATGQIGFSDYLTSPQGSYFQLAPTVNPTDALGEPLACVTNVLRATEPQAGDFGVILGCGPMGLWCTQVLSGHLLAGLIAVDTQDWRLDLARKFGATHTINPKTEDAEARLAEITGGHSADFVIEGTGVPAVIAQAASYLRRGQGRLSIMSSHEEGGPAFDWRPIIGKGIQIRGTHPAWAPSMQEELRRAVLLLNQGVFQMEGVITHRFPLADAQEAMEALENKPEGFLKGVIVP